MPRALTALNATVTTATVTIRTLTIDRRQVTLSTFRQVPERDIFTEEGELRGVPWGRVNYCPGTRCTEVGAVDSRHDHLLWQQGETLFRCRLAAGVGLWTGYDRHERDMALVGYMLDGRALRRQDFIDRVEAERDVWRPRAASWQAHAAVLADLDQLYIAT